MYHDGYLCFEDLTEVNIVTTNLAGSAVAIIIELCSGLPHCKSQEEIDAIMETPAAITFLASEPVY